MDPSGQDGGDVEASTPLNPVRDGAGPRRQPGRRLAYLKPLLVMAVGALLFGLGTALSLFFFSHTGNVPDLLGPLFLSVGLLFLVAGLVWIPLLKPYSQ